jgi:hypothetical protein
MTGKIIAVVKNKGGVGKTTVACNLGAALAQQQRRVLVLDPDSQCNASRLLLSGDQDFGPSLYELLDPGQTGPVFLEDFIYPAALPDLCCLPNVAEASGLEIDLVSRYPQSLHYLRTRTRYYLRENFDMVLMDNPPRPRCCPPRFPSMLRCNGRNTNRKSCFRSIGPPVRPWPMSSWWRKLRRDWAKGRRSSTHNCCTENNDYSPYWWDHPFYEKIWLEKKIVWEVNLMGILIYPKAPNNMMA